MAAGTWGRIESHGNEALSPGPIPQWERGSRKRGGTQATRGERFRLAQHGDQPGG